MGAFTSNGDKRSRTSPRNGAHSNGAKTPEGIVARAVARTTHGIMSWTPVLPTECEEDWAALRDGIDEDWQPVGRTEQELTLCLSMAFWQRRRLYRHEKELVIRQRQGGGDSFVAASDDDEEGELLRRHQYGTAGRLSCVKRSRSVRLSWPCSKCSRTSLTRCRSIPRMRCSWWNKS